MSDLNNAHEQLLEFNAQLQADLTAARAEIESLRRERDTPLTEAQREADRLLRMSITEAKAYANEVANHLATQKRCDALRARVETLTNALRDINRIALAAGFDMHNLLTEIRRIVRITLAVGKEKG